MIAKFLVREASAGKVTGALEQVVAIFDYPFGYYRKILNCN